ncbi:MAG: hypothetical protein ACSHX8_16085 [Opitutaceae bacterium]
MITPSDKEYQETKQLKRGKKALREPFQEMAIWISERKNKNVLNVVYDPPKGVLKRPRIKIIVENSGSEPLFSRDKFISEKADEPEIIEHFKGIIERDQLSGFGTEDMFVVFSNFSEVAKQDVDNQITEKDLERIIKRIGNPEIWKIVRCFGSVTFMFHTEEQKERHEKEGFRSKYASEYFNELKPHDEFGYLDRDSYQVYFDSKQNFDENYQSNWFYYFR